MCKSIFISTAIIGFSLLAFSCKSTDVPPAPVVEPVIEEPAPEPEPEEPTEIDDEFSRSTQEVTITKEEFNADKAAILKIINELSSVMTDRNYNAWLTYIDPESITYWSNPTNLKQASKRLPVKGMKLANLNDYFTFVFVPSRKGREVDEIRYISLSSVKAVQNSDNQDIVYYNFVKVDGKWMVKLPPNQSQHEE